MARPFIVPDPKARSVNEPGFIVNSAQVLGLYNQENPSDKKERVVDKVKEWYMERMIDEGWDSAEFNGNQCILQAKVQLITKKGTLSSKQKG